MFDHRLSVANPEKQKNIATDRKEK